MLTFSQMSVARYCGAAIFVCVALAITVQVEIVATQTPFALFFFAVVAAGWILGRGPGLFAEFLSAIGAQFLLIPQIREIQPDVPRSFQFGAFLIIGTILVWVTSSVKKYLTTAADIQENFESLFERNPFPVLLVDRKSNRVLAVNPSATDIYGYTADEFAAISLDDLCFDKDSPSSALADRGDGRVAPVSVSKHRRKNGTAAYVELISQDQMYEGRPARLIHAIDVTERIRTSEALKTSEARLQQVFGSCPVSMTVHRWSDRTFLDVNAEFTELTGWSLDDIKGKTATECGLLTVEAESQLVARLNEHDTISDCEIELTTKSGRRRNVVIGAVFVELSGELRVIASFVDVTELRRAEQRHVVSEERLRLVTEKARVGLVLINERRRFTFVNSAYADIFGLPPVDVAGRRVAEVHADLYTNQIGPNLDRAFAGQSFNFELRQNSAAGTRYFDVRLEPAEVPGEEAAVVAVVTDITDRTRAEIAKEASEERYRTLFEYSPDGIAIADQNSFYLDANETLCRMLGYTREEFVGLHATHIFVPREVPHLGKTLYGENDDLEYYQDWTYRRKDGSTFPGDVVATVMPDGNLLTVIRDMTERKQLEDQLLQAQKMEAIGVLAGGVAHDFNNILTAISGYSELTLQNMSIDDPARDYINEISDAGNRAAALTRQLLSFGRRSRLTPTIHNLNDTVTDTERMLGRIVKENIKFRIDIARDLWNIKVDPSQITQVLVNLVVNAGDAMPNGGTLTISTRNRHLDGDFIHENVVVTSGPFVELTVTDTGIGMDGETQRRLFEPFFTTKETGKGTGLGLSTVYGIVKQSGGDVVVESKLGEGSTFKIYLPASIETSIPSEPVTEYFNESSASATILLVEDEPAVRHLVGSVLERSGYHVIPADGGDQALDICRSFDGQIDLLLTDMIMPGMDGNQIRSEAVAIRPGLRSIIMSGYVGETAAANSHNPDEAFIGKPFAAEDLVRSVRSVLAKPAQVRAVSG